MATIRSDEAVHGSVGARHEPRPAVTPNRAGVQATAYTQDPTVPVNVVLALPSTLQPAARRRDHRELLDSIDNLFGGQRHPAGSSAAAATATTTTTTGMGVVRSGSASMDVALRGVGARFGVTQSTSAGRPAGPSEG
ncbi:hypothetical protein F5Y05DRAFT_412258 [Hypoxylon sp. FL0543]|nr:hypothetical protein F5Y05DRAFT_412258 [Hypoxylon sp. FL0543]